MSELFRAAKLPAAPWIILILLITTKALVILLVVPYPATGLPNGDAKDYVAKSRSLWCEGRLDADTKSFRPLGYSFFLAPLLAFGDSDRAVNVEARILNTMADVCVCLFVFWIASLWLRHWWCLMTAAVVIGVQPWTGAYVHNIVPDHVASCLLTFGIGALAMSVVLEEGARRRRWLLIGSTLLSASFLVRPELIVFSAFLIFCAIIMRGFRWKRLLTDALWASLPFLVAMSCEVCYRVHVGDGFRVFGTLTPRYSGVRSWQRTWAAEEQVKHDIVFGWVKGRIGFPYLPARAFDTEDERARVGQILERIIRTGQGLTLDEDKVLRQIAEERIARSPWRYYVGVRLYNVTQYLVSLRHASDITNYLNNLPYAISFIAKGGLFSLRLLMVVMFLFGCVCLLADNRAWLSARPLLLLAAAMVWSRLLFLFICNGMLEIRYFVVSWPSLLLVSLYGLDHAYTFAGSLSARVWSNLSSGSQPPQREDHDRCPGAKLEV
jgi:hypothetical protein